MFTVRKCVCNFSWTVKTAMSACSRRQKFTVWSCYSILKYYLLFFGLLETIFLKLNLTWGTYLMRLRLLISEWRVFINKIKKSSFNLQNKIFIWMLKINTIVYFYIYAYVIHTIMTKTCKLSGTTDLSVINCHFTGRKWAKLPVNRSSLTSYWITKMLSTSYDRNSI